MNKEKRSDIRIPLISEAIIVWHEGVDALSAGILDISENGAFIHVDAIKDIPKPKMRSLILFALPGDLGNLDLVGTVCRVNWVSKKNRPMGFAIKFDEMNTGTKKIWDSYRTYLRNKQIMTVSRRIREEFFGSQE